MVGVSSADRAPFLLGRDVGVEWRSGLAARTEGVLPVSIRKATSGDRDRLIELACAFRREFPTTNRIEPDPTQMGMVVDACLDYGCILVSEDDGGITGLFAMLVGSHPLTMENMAFEVAWYVDPAARGGSAAMRLVKDAEEEARTRGADVMQIGSPNDSVSKTLGRLGYGRREVEYTKELH